jgi:site-specific DNA-methyltransferase (adenine-specific)
MRVVHCKKSPYDVYIGRPSKWGNPFNIGKDGTREEVIEKYEIYLRGNEELLGQIEELRDKVLGCYCAPLACHGDILIKVLNEAAVQNNTILHGKCEDILSQFPDNHFHAVITDPPYGLSPNLDVSKLMKEWLEGKEHDAGKGFMAQAWDKLPGPEIWKEIMRVLKPGGHLISFSSPRTQDLIGMAIRLSGAEIRDSVAWVQGQGFPKGLNVGKQIDKLAGETPKSVGANPVAGQFSAGDNIYGFGKYKKGDNDLTEPATDEAKKWAGYKTQLKPSQEPIISATKGEEDASIEDENAINYCKKASKKEKHAGCEELYWKKDTEGNLILVGKSDYDTAVKNKEKTETGNIHKTVKPINLMRELIKLVMPPDKDAIVLDPFAGSGSTCIGALLEGYNYVGVEADENHVKVAEARIKYWYDSKHGVDNK